MSSIRLRASRAVLVNAASYLVLCSAPLLAGMMVSTPADAQSAGQALPPVVVDLPSRPAARSAPVRARQSAQTTGRRRQAQRAPSNPDAASAAPGIAAETATGPVRGYIANLSGTGTKTSTPLRETPQSITVVTADRIKDQGATTVQESVRYVPGVYADAYGPDSRGEGIRIRGQDPNFYLDGMRTNSSASYNEWRPDPYTLERDRGAARSLIHGLRRHFGGRPSEHGFEASPGPILE